MLVTKVTKDRVTIELDYEALWFIYDHLPSYDGFTKDFYTYAIEPVDRLRETDG